MQPTIEALKDAELKFTVQTKINRPVADVFDAIVDDKKIVKYFARTTTGPLREGQSVQWGWNSSACGPETVEVQRLVPNELIQFAWGTIEGDYRTVVEMRFETLSPTQTMVKITEGGWRPNKDGVKNAFGNCEGWQHMASCLKAYIEHGIDLRE